MYNYMPAIAATLAERHSLYPDPGVTHHRIIYVDSFTIASSAHYIMPVGEAKVQLFLSSNGMLDLLIYRAKPNPPNIDAIVEKEETYAMGEWKIIDPNCLEEISQLIEIAHQKLLQENHMI